MLGPVDPETFGKGSEGSGGNAYDSDDGEGAGIGGGQRVQCAQQ
jgi:hypothetical protein